MLKESDTVIGPSLGLFNQNVLPNRTPGIEARGIPVHTKIGEVLLYKPVTLCANKTPTGSCSEPCH